MPGTDPTALAVELIALMDVLQVQWVLAPEQIDMAEVPPSGRSGAMTRAVQLEDAPTWAIRCEDDRTALARSGDAVLADLGNVLPTVPPVLARLAADPHRRPSPAADGGRVRVDVVLSFSNNGLFTALQEKNAAAFWWFVIIFGVIAAISVLLALVSFFIAQAQIIHWRQWLNQRMLGDWLTGAAYHRGRFVAAQIDNPDQRIQQDVTSFAATGQGLAIGAVSSMVSLVSFSLVLWGLSGPLQLAGITIPRGMVFLAYVYVIIATVIAFKIGRPLIRLNFLNERYTASYRYALVRLRENSENVAFYHAEQVEGAGLLARFGLVIANTWAIVFRSLKAIAAA